MDEENDDYDSDSSIDNIVAKLKQEYPKVVVRVVKPPERKNPSRIDADSQTLNQCETLNFEALDATQNYDSTLVISECFIKPFLPCTSFEDKTNSHFQEVLPSSSNQHSFSGVIIPPSDTSFEGGDYVFQELLPATSEHNIMFDEPVFQSSENNSEEDSEVIDDPDWRLQTTSDSENLSESEDEHETVAPDELPTNPNANQISIGKEKKNRKRKVDSDPAEWHDAKNKLLREQGKAYIGWNRPKDKKGERGTQREERKMGEPCNSESCKKSKIRKCESISEEERKELFKNFWEILTWDQKKIYVLSLVTKSEKSETIKKQGEKSRRNFTYSYRIKKNNGKEVFVCKTMFLNTFGLKEWSVLNWVSNDENKLGMIPSKENTNKKRRASRTLTIDNKKQLLEQFLEKLTKLPSHYCRKSSNKIYLEPTGTGSNMADVYTEYKRVCAENPEGALEPLSRFTFSKVVAAKNLAFQPPKKDRCDLCISYEAGHVSQDEYKMHISRKETARIEKTNDKKKGEEGKCLVLTQDLQSVKICPSLNASALYYKTKLLCHNFTIFDINKKYKPKCFWFDETQSDLSANTFASFVLDYLNNICVDKTPVVLWSDGCTSQNRNAIFSNALLSFCHEKDIRITQKFLEKGHTQMEVDSVHAVIERKIKNKPIHLPSDYIRYTPNNYETEAVTFDTIKNFSLKETMMYDSIRPGKKAGDPTVTDLRVIEYYPYGEIKMKLSFNSDYVHFPQRKKFDTPTRLLDFPQMHQNKLKITRRKWQHLQELKAVLPADCHPFYDFLEFEDSSVDVKKKNPKTK